MFQCSYKKQNYLFRLIFFQWVIFGSSTITDFGWTLLYSTDHKCRLGWLSNCNLWTHAFLSGESATFPSVYPFPFIWFAEPGHFFIFSCHTSRHRAQWTVQCTSLDTAGWLLLSRGSVLRFRSPVTICYWTISPTVPNGSATHFHAQLQAPFSALNVKG